MSEEINKQFDDFQKDLENRKKKFKFITKVNTSDEFYKLIDEISGSNLSNERDRRKQDTESK